jgi:diguanylate cyclase (GGDEF)-like protein
VIGANVKMLVPPPHAVQHDTYLANYLRTGQAKIIGTARDVEAVRKDGTVFPIALNVTELNVGSYRGFTGVMRDITERKLAEEQIRHLAHHDMITGLPNRTLFNDRLRQAMAQAKRERHKLALLYLDLDKFKAVNDNFGHDVGDGLLRHVAERLLRHTRESDTVARIGGDEFTVILPNITSRDDIAIVAGKIIATLCTPFDLDGNNEMAQLGVSIGIAIYPTDAQDIEALVKAGDVAMYKAKRAGNSFRFCEA